MKKSAFTLAEVLITLTVIGIVASLTVPTLMNNVQDQQYKTAWKKIYADLDQATRLTIQNNGGSVVGTIVSNDDSMKNIYEPYLNVVKSCSFGNYAGICWHNANTWKTMDNSIIVSNYSADSGFSRTEAGTGSVLNNGMLIRYYTYGACSTTHTCGYILVDINGFKPPNIVGKDIFGVHLLYNSIKPFGNQGDGNETTCISSGTGLGCSTKYLYE